MTLVDRDLDCLSDEPEPRTVHVVRPDGLERLFARLTTDQAAFLRVGGITGAAGELMLLPGPEGVAGAVLGLGTEGGPFAFGVLPTRLPASMAWRLEPGDYDVADGVLGFCLGSYRYTALPGPEGEPRALACLTTQGIDAAVLRRATSAARATWLVRDLINTPANLLGPGELADAVRLVGQALGATVERIEGAALEAGYPALAAVGRGSARPPVVAVLRWSGSRADEAAPLVSLCGKGVVFDTGGYDIKPSRGMLRMKKACGRAACGRRGGERPAVAAAACRRLCRMAGKPGCRPVQRRQQADGRRDHRGVVPSAFRCRRRALGPYRHLRLERRQPSRPAGGRGGADDAGPVRYITNRYKG